MRKTKPIDGAKLKELVLNRGHITHISADMGYSHTALGLAIKSNKISEPMAVMLDKMFGIKYEAYKPKEEEPIQDEPKSETTVVSKDEALLKVIIAQLMAINNELGAIYKKIEEI